jgi:sugar phosphate isomerase/epimerase
MIRHPLGLRLDADRSVRDQIYEAARLGARGVVIDAIGDVAPHRLGETGRREMRQILRTAELSLVALSLPTRRSFDTTDQLDDRMRRADAAFSMAYELGTTIVLARAGAVPPSEDEARLEIFTNSLLELGRRAEHHGVKLAMETGSEAGQKLKEFLDALESPGLAASIDPSSILQAGIDPIVTVRELASWVVHAYAKDATGSSGVNAVNPRGFGYPPGALDWEEYLGSLEEIGYRGFLTVWPTPGRPAADQFKGVLNRLQQVM